jgi:hypothetical protein
MISTPVGQEWHSAMINPPGLCGVDNGGLLRNAARVAQSGAHNPRRQEKLARSSRCKSGPGKG